MKATLASLVVALGLSTSVYAAGTVHLTIHDGRVDLFASGASIPQILDEWARVGGTRVINAERLPAAPVTLELNHVTEAQAIDVLLRSAAGFIAIPRRAASAGPSQFERILILATSNAPAAPAPVATPAAAFPTAPPPFAAPPPVRMLPAGAAPVLGPDGRPVADDQDGATQPQNGYSTNDEPRNVTSMPPGFAPPSAPATGATPMQPPSAATQPPAAAPAAPQGSSTPGTVIKPQPQRRPGGR